MTMKGEKLFDLLVRLSGIEKEAAEAELTHLMSQLGIDRDNMTTDDVRKLMAAYLEHVDTARPGAKEIVLAPMATELEAEEPSLLETPVVAKA